MLIVHTGRPLFRPDPGWLFIGAGLALIVAAIIIPPRMRLHTFRERAAAMRAAELASIERLKAYNSFLEALEAEDPQLVQRLVAAQLNLIPTNCDALMIAASSMAPVTSWIESTVRTEPIAHTPFPRSTLALLATGPRRHWLLGFACACLFVGLVIGNAEDAPSGTGGRDTIQT